MLKTIVATALLACTTALYAQTPPAPDADKAARRQEIRAKAKDAREDARKACEGKQGDEHASCMKQAFCAKAKDPAKCQERIEKRAEHMKERRAEKQQSDKK